MRLRLINSISRAELVIQHRPKKPMFIGVDGKRSKNDSFIKPVRYALSFRPDRHD